MEMATILYTFGAENLDDAEIDKDSHNTGDKVEDFEM